MKYLFIIIISLVVLEGCKNRVPTKKKIPSNIIDKETMAKILADMYIADNLVNISFRKNPADKKKVHQYYFVIFRKYGITKEKFQESIDFYLMNPDILIEVYDNVTEILNTQQIE